MQVGVDVLFMHTSFGGHDPSSFGDMATFQKRYQKGYGSHPVCVWSTFPFWPLFVDKTGSVFKKSNEVA